jgi:hypothetical protein
MIDDNNEKEDDCNDDVVNNDHEPEHGPHEHPHGYEHGHWCLHAPAVSGFLQDIGMHADTAHGNGSGSGSSGSPHEQITSPHQQYQGQRQEAATTVPSAQSPSALESNSGTNFPSQPASDALFSLPPLLNHPPSTPR